MFLMAGNLLFEERRRVRRCSVRHAKVIPQDCSLWRGLVVGWVKDHFPYFVGGCFLVLILALWALAIDEHFADQV